MGMCVKFVGGEKWIFSVSMSFETCMWDNVL